jgi:hypothetical protein
LFTCHLLAAPKERTGRQEDRGQAVLRAKGNDTAGRRRKQQDPLKIVRSVHQAHAKRRTGGVLVDAEGIEALAHRLQVLDGLGEHLLRDQYAMESK